MTVAGLVVLVLVGWAAPVAVGAHLGRGKRRDDGWVYPLLLGWLGVLIVALLPARTEAVREAARAGGIPPLPDGWK